MDNKQKEILKTVSTLLPECCDVATCYCYGSIPIDKFRNACNEYAGSVDYSECIGLTDETLFGSGKRGFLFTFDGFYYDGCSSKKYYTEGISFNKLSSQYDQHLMNEMLNQLYQISKKKSGFETFLDCASAVAGEFLNQATEQFQRDQEKKRRQESEEVIDVLKSYKTFLKNFQSMLNQLVEYDFSEMDSEDCDIYFGKLLRSAAILANDTELYEKTQDEALSEETKETLDSAAEIVDILSDLLETDTDDHKPVYLKQAIQAYHSSVDAIADEMEDVGEDYEAFVRLFDKGQRAAEKLKKKMKEAISYINDALELAYEELDD